jgi:hypothetical protein
MAFASGVSALKRQGFQGGDKEEKREKHVPMSDVTTESFPLEIYSLNALVGILEGFFESWRICCNHKDATAIGINPIVDFLGTSVEDTD